MGFIKKPGGVTPEEAEMIRILNLPVEKTPDPEEVEIFCFDNMLAEAFERGERLFPIQVAAVDAYRRHGGGLLPIGVGWGKCLDGSTEIYDLVRGRRKVSEVGSTITPSVLPDCKQIPAEASIFESGEKECMRVRLEAGQEVVASEDHPILTEKGWCRARDLRVGDYVATPRNLPSPMKEAQVPDAEVKVIAYMSGDGACNRNKAEFTNQYDAVWNDFLYAVEEAGGFRGRYECSAGIATTRSLVGIRPLLRKHGIDKLSKEKRVPADWYNLPIRQVLIYLRAFLACDGHFAVRGRTPRVEVGLASHGMVVDLRHFLLRLGIQSTIQHRRSGYEKGDRKRFQSWVLRVNGNEAISLCELLGFVPGKEEICRTIARLPRTRAGTKDTVSVGRQEAREIADELGMPRTLVRGMLGATNSQRIGRRKFAEFCQNTGYKGKHAWKAASDVFWSPVKEIESVGVRKVYDLNVPGTESWIGNHVVLHNTGISLMIADAAYRQGRKKILLLIPVQQVQGLHKRHVPEWRKRVPFAPSLHFLSARPAPARKTLVDQGAPGIYVFPYSLLSATDALYLLDKIRPDLVIADEVHNLKNPRAARTKRLLHVLKEQKPAPQFVGMSGTITAKKIGDYHHLATLALGEKSPLPRTAHMSFSWGQLIDTDAGPSPTGHAVKLMRPLLTWASENFPEEGRFRVDQTESYRRAYRLRLTSAPGVVATGDEEIGVSLCLQNLEPDQPGPRLLELIEQVQEDYITPQGEPIDHALHTFKWVYELSAGFYNSLIWPTEEDLQRNRRIGPMEAKLLLTKAKIHHAAAQAYHSALREFFKDSPPGLDTPREVARSIAKHGAKFVPAEVASAYSAMKEADFEGRPERVQVPVRIDDFKVRHAVKWAKELPEGRGGIIWVWHQEAGVWLVEALQEAGLDPLHCPAGADELIEGVGDPMRGGKGDRIVVASISSHGTGRNLQAFQHQLFFQWPRSPQVAEQTLGRMHRNGQEAEELIAHTNMVLQFDHVCRAATLNDAIYIQQTTGSRQKIVFADYDPLPMIFSEEFLRENGTNPDRLNPAQREMLRNLFGPEVE